MKSRYKYLFLIVFIFLMVSLPLFGGGNKEVPQVPPATSGVQYLSPNNDGVQDTAVLEFTVKIRVKSEEGFVPEYGLQIVSESGQVVKTVVEREKSDLGWFRALFRGFEEFTLTRKIHWDGMDMQGNPVPEGTYKARMWVVDTSKNRKEVNLDDFIVDTTPPEAEVTAPELLLFSPDGDGIMDTFLIRQSGSRETLWTASFSNAGGVVKSYRFENSPPQDIEWDGGDNTGNLVPDGEYNYLLRSTDLAGNKSKEYRIDGIVVDTRPRALSMEVLPGYFSPKAVEVQDKVVIRPIIPPGEGVAEGFLRITDKAGEEILYQAWEGDPPLEIPFLGLNEEGEILSEGDYHIHLSVQFNNGSILQTEGKAVLDVTLPDISVEVDNRIFSPDGDGRKDNVRIGVRSSEPVSYTGAVVDGSGRKVVEISSPVADLREGTAVWDGKDMAGRAVADGEYYLEGSFTDRAGNKVSPERIRVSLDTRKIELGLQVPEYYSLRASREGMRIGLGSTQYDQVESWVIGVEDSTGRVVRRINGMDRLPESVVWNGQTDAGSAPDGRYRANLAVVYRKGTEASVYSPVFTVDSTPPAVSVEVDNRIFSPDGDGRKDNVRIGVRSSEPVSYTGAVVDGSGRKVVEISSPVADLREGTAVWDGKDMAGRAVADGEYYLEGSFTDRAGNKVSPERITITLDTTPPVIALSAKSKPFYHDGDKVVGEVLISLSMLDQIGVSSWGILVYDETGKKIKDVKATGKPPAEILWDSRKETDFTLAEGVYALEIAATDAAGNSTVKRYSVESRAIAEMKNSKLYLLVDNIIFAAYKHTLDSAGADLFERNKLVLTEVVNILNRFQGYSVKLEAHALNIYGYDKKKYEQEEQILQPLTERRAATVRQALIERGIPASRIRQEAFGGRFPIASTTDKKVWWLNRRVEFLLVFPE